MGLSNMIQQVYWLNSSNWPILNLHAIIARNLPSLDMRDASSESQQLFRISKFYPYISTIQVIVINDRAKWQMLTNFPYKESDESDGTGLCARIGRCKKVIKDFMILCIENMLKRCLSIFEQELKMDIAVFISLWTCLCSDLVDIDRLPTV